MGQSQLKNKVDVLRQENEKMQGQCMPVQQHVRDMKLSSKYQQDTSDHRTQQLQQDLEKIGKKKWKREQRELGTQEKDSEENLRYHFEVLQESNLPSCFLTGLN